MQKLFGYPKFDDKGRLELSTYYNDYKYLQLDSAVYNLNCGQTKYIKKSEEETIVLLLSGSLNLKTENKNFIIKRKNVFLDGPYALHFCCGKYVEIEALENSEFIEVSTKNSNIFKSKLYTPEMSPYKYCCQGLFNNTASRRVCTIIDYSIQPQSNLVLGETVNDRGNWSSYLPHRHPQPELYFFKFDHPSGFGASFIGNNVFKSVNNSFAAIPGQHLHPQAVAPGFQMYTCWIIRHLKDNPWLQTDRFEDESFLWLKDVK